MIRKTLIITLFTCVGLVLTGVTLLATYENRYYEILRLKRESERIPEAERRAKAKEIAAKMYDKYMTSKNLRFEAYFVEYWCTHGSLKSRLPMDWWRRQHSVARFDMAMTPVSLRTEVSVFWEGKQFIKEGKRLFAFFWNNGLYREFKWPHNGVPGMRTEFHTNCFKTGKPTHLREGVEGSVLCSRGVHMMPWNSPQVEPWVAWKPETTWFKEKMEGGLWIGSAKVRGEQCDVIATIPFVTADKEESYHVYYVNPEGFVVMWITPDSRPEGDPNREIWVDRFTNFRTDPIPPETFSPSEALLEEAKTWSVVPQEGCE